LALIMTDLHAGGFVRWVFFNVDSSTSGGFPTGFFASPEALRREGTARPGELRLAKRVDALPVRSSAASAYRKGG